MKLSFMNLDAFYDFLVEKNRDLVFDSENGDVSFSIGLDGTLTFEKSNPTDGLIPVHLQAAHIGKNKNKSKISETSMERNKTSIKDRPILAYIHEIDVDGETKNVFGWHAMHEDKNGDVVYDEIPVGHVPSNAKPILVYDEGNDRTYIEVDGYLYENYTKAGEILADNNGECPVSVEIDVIKFSYDAKEKILNIDDFTFRGITILGYFEDGTPVNPAMEGANIALMNFNVEENPLEINQNSMKGGENEMDLFEQLLEQYNVTAEDITFDHENLTDDELRAKFEEVFGSKDENLDIPDSNFDDGDSNGEDNSDDGNESSDDENEEELGVQDEAPLSSIKKNNSITCSINGKEFSVSLNDKIYALNVLVNDAYSESDNAYYNVIVYDKELVMVDCWNGSAFRQGYSERSGVFSLKGDRVPVHAIYVTDTEEQQLDDMRSKFSNISEELNKYKDAEEAEKKKKIINSSEWELISDSVEFAQVKNDYLSYSVEDLQAKCDALLLAYIKNNSVNPNIAKDTSAKHTFQAFRVPETNVESHKRYGNIFD